MENTVPTVLLDPATDVCDEDYEGIGSYEHSTREEVRLEGQSGV